MRNNTVLCLLSTILCAGCMGELEKQTQKTPGNIIGKKTQDIGEFKPAPGQKVMKDDRPIITDTTTAPVTAPLQAYGPALEKISKSHIEHAVRLYEAENGHYPKDHEEFMTKIIKAQNIQLPVLPGGLQYKYDVAEHKLIVVKIEDATPAPPKK